MSDPVCGPARVGIDLGPGPATAVLVDGDDRIVARCTDPGGPDPAGTLRRLLAGVLPPAPGPVRAVVSCAGPAGRLDEPGLLDRVGVLRIGAPATTGVPPLTGWPDDLAGAVEGPVAVIGGGHLHDGEEITPLDEAAVVAFGRHCVGEVAAVAVTAVASHLDPGHEQRAAALLATVLGTDVPVVTAHGFGGVGLLERENTAVLDAALARRAGALTGALAAAAGPDAELYLMDGGGHVLSPERAALHPLLLAGAPHATVRAGMARLTGRPTLVVLDSGPDGLRIGGLVDGLVPDTGMFREVRGIRLALQADRVVHLDPDDPGDGVAASFAERVRAGIERVGAPLGEAPVAVAGSPGPVPLPAPEGALRPPGADVAVAYGAATAEASATVDRLYRFADGSLADGVALARQAARDGAVRAGADPRRVRVGAVREVAMTYVPMPCVRLRVTATGPLVAPARAAEAW